MPVSENERAHPLCRRCPRLGGPVTFRYCLTGESSGPCFKVIDCWWETFDVVRFLQDHLTRRPSSSCWPRGPCRRRRSLAGLAARLKPTRP